MLFQNTGLTRAMYQFFQTLIYVAPATLFAVSLHEFAHGYVSYKPVSYTHLDVYKRQMLYCS